MHNKIGFWYSVCKERIPDAVFLEQSELSALHEIVSASKIPSLITNITNGPDAVPENKVSVPCRIRK